MNKTRIAAWVYMLITLTLAYGSLQVEGVLSLMIIAVALVFFIVGNLLFAISGVIQAVQEGVAERKE